MNNFLHIDTSGDAGIIALSSDGSLTASRRNLETRNHASSINILVADILSESHLTLNDLSAVVVCAGPGSYTGLRIGMATAKGFCYALDIPLLLDNKLDLLALQVFNLYRDKYSFFVSTIPAREQEYFVSIFDKNFINILPAKHIMESDLPERLAGMQNLCFISQSLPASLAGKIEENINMVSIPEIDLSCWAVHTFEQYKCNKTVNLSTAEPFYLKQVYTHK